MSSLWFYSDPIDRLHQENVQFLALQRWLIPMSTSNRLVLAREAEYLVMQRIQELGYTVTPTTRCKPFDLCVEGARIEVKAAKWYQNGRGGRYQARIHHHDADLVVFDCMNGSHHFFVIPMEAIVPRHNIAISNYDPEMYIGQWMPYLDAWGHLTDAIKAAHRSWQPPLFDFGEF